MSYVRTLSAAIVLLAGTASVAAAQGADMKEEKPGLLAQAKIKPEAARQTALKAVPGATIKEAEIEREHRKLVYSFDLTVPGQTGIQEVLVDANTGKIVSSKHESPADEAREAAQDKKKEADHEKKPY
jgi:uncharacterized membrane protein YkoI